jgi:DNA repair protein RadC
MGTAPTGPHYARELTVMYRTHPAKVLINATQITTAAEAAAVVVPILRPQVQEVVICLHLDTKRRLLGVQEVARGGVDAVHVPIRMILTAALGEKNSQGILVAHNHPSGDPEPSVDDLMLTRKIAEALGLVEIDLIDHIIVGAEAYVSFRETGRMRNY